MDQLMMSSGGGSSTMMGGGGGDDLSQQQQNQQQKQEQEVQRQKDFKNQVLNQILDQQARARLSTLSLAKPEKAQAVENLLINMARMGRFGMGAKVNEAQLIEILDKVGGTSSSSAAGSSGVNFTRRRVDDDDDDEYNKIMEDL